MRIEISKAVKKNLVGWGVATLAEVKRYAVHHEQHGQTEKRKKENRKDEFLMAVLEDKAMEGKNREWTEGGAIASPTGLLAGVNEDLCVYGVS